jgi:putative endonuclease
MRQGFDILARRFSTGSGEIDLVAFEGELLVFLEVKTRASTEYGDPFEFVDWQKQQKFRRAAEEFIACHDLGQYAYRFDIVTVVAPATPCEKIALYRDAF